MPYQPTGTSGGPNPTAAISSQSDGKTFEQLRQECLQKKKFFEDPDFPACDSSLFYSERVPINFEWKRPGEICKDPKFILGGADRTDICQGQLGDCWLLAAVASMTLHKETLTRVVPPEQNFEQGYAGIFHFQFWQHNKWLDVVVDDRLPTVRSRLIFLHSADSNEFWSALLEKAYAKLNGSYEALKGGSTLEALEDFSGGVGEVYETKSPPEQLFQILQKALHRGSMMGCSIDITSSAESEAQTTTGLVKGHAYSITGVEEVKFRGRVVQLIRIRNPWGQVEWNGPWSDNSSEWNLIDKAEKNRLLETATDDGEFWMEFNDFKNNYDRIEICNLTPESLSDSNKKKWEVKVFEGNWIRGSTAGGCRNYIDTFWTNPQFKLTLVELDKDDNEHLCNVIIAVMQKNRRKLRKEGLDLETIGFAVYECPDGEDHADKDFFRYNASKARSKSYINVRELSQRFQLPAGNYLLVPTIFQPHREADFLIRIFSETKVNCLEMGNSIEANLPEPPKPSAPEEETKEEQGLRKLFQQIAGSDQVISAWELQHVLTEVLRRRQEVKFDHLSIDTCHSMINLMDVDNSGTMDFQEFKIFWDKFKKWMFNLQGSTFAYFIAEIPYFPEDFVTWINRQADTWNLFNMNLAPFTGEMLFLSFDTDRSGRMSSYELRSALKAAGMQVNNKLLQLICLRFGDSNLEIDFDDYLTCIVRLENMFRVFQALDSAKRGVVSMNFSQFLLLSMNV